MNLIIRSYSNSTSYKILEVLNKILLRFFLLGNKNSLSLHHEKTKATRLDFIPY